MPVLAIQHFFILFEILRSLYADVDVDVRHGAELLDSILKEIVVQAINSGTFTVEACVPVFSRFVYIRNKVRHVYCTS
jgi:vacuole morphology and inheritance protein 14